MQLVNSRIIYIKTVSATIGTLFVFGAAPASTIFAILQRETLINWLAIAEYPSWISKKGEKKTNLIG